MSRVIFESTHALYFKTCGPHLRCLGHAFNYVSFWQVVCNNAFVGNNLFFIKVDSRTVQNYKEYSSVKR